jgi:hypothetical protein
MDRPIVRDFDEIRIAVDRAMLHAALGMESHLNFEIDEFLNSDPHTIMLLTWLEMQQDRTPHED